MPPVCHRLPHQAALQQRELSDSAVRLSALPDPRHRRGMRHTFASVLLTAACAVLAGARSYLAIGQWARHAPQDTLARLGFHARGPLGVRRPASPSTLRRVLVLVCPGGLADLLGHDPASTPTIAVDGKSARGSRTAATPATHLLSAVTAASRVVSQLRVPDKTNEISAFTALLAPFDLAGTVVTADALHTQREHAKWLVEVKKAHYLLVVKGNQPKLHAAIKALPWKDVTARRYDRERGHGRRETRSVRTLTVTGLGLDFPHVVQAVKILRHRTDLKTGKVTRQTVYAIRPGRSGVSRRCTT
ncbi:ISAs1 family transposase [Streptomyces virginiae]|uniref:ISAs1 family transposase n=1 Tax=Streptomyces virginiae TaxID=1961 RepID=UPI000B052D61